MDSTRHGLLLSPLLCTLGATTSACTGGLWGAEQLAGPGFVIDGAEPGDAIVAVPIADVDGDGLGEVLVNVERPLHPVAFLVFGKSDAKTVDLAAIEAGKSDAGILLDFGEETTDEYTFRTREVVAVGDVNGDGLTDLGAALYGRALARDHVVFGAADLPSPLDLQAVSVGPSGFTIDTSLGTAIDGPRYIHGVGDVNGDGFDDLLLAQVGGFSDHYALVFGGPQTPAKDLDDLEAGIGGVFVTYAYSARVLPPADVNGDGFADLVYAEYGGPNRGFSGVELRRGAPDFGPNPPPSAVTVQSDFYDAVNLDAAAVGDLDGDGLSDVVAVADTGQALTAFVVFGAALDDAVDIPETFPGHGYRVDLTGLEIESGIYNAPLFPPVEAVRDLNADGKDDLLVRTTTGTYLLFGKADFGAQVLIDDGIRLDDLALGEHLGIVTGWGSIRGGAPTDLVITDPEASPSGRSGAGRAYVLFDALADSS
jgi:hypothetical protein